MQQLLEMPLFGGRLLYIQGSPMMLKDLQRVRADTANACFVCCNKTAEDHRAEDANILCCLLEFKAFNPDLAMHVEVMDSVSRNYIQGPSGFMSTFFWL